MVRRYAHVSAGLLVAAFGGACEDPGVPPPGALDVSSSLPLCAGTLPALTTEAERIEGTLGLDWLHKITIEVLEPGEIAEACAVVGAEPVAGCARGTGEFVHVFSILDAVPHELTHALRKQHEIGGTPLFEEGLADALSGGVIKPFGIVVDPEDWALGPKELLAMDRAEFPAAPASYLIAAHFFGFLASRFGEAHVISALSDEGYRTAMDTDAYRAWFEDAFGLTIDDADQEWRDSGYFEYRRGSQCAESTTVRLEVDGAQTFGQENDCEHSVDTIGPLWGGGSESFTRIRRWCLDSDAGQLEIEGNGNGVSLNLSALACDDVDPETVEHLSFELEAGFQGPVEACEWLVIASGTEPYAYQAELRLR